MKRLLQFRNILFFILSLGLAGAALATSNYEYKPDEYVVIANGKSPSPLTVKANMAMKIFISI